MGRGDANDGRRLDGLFGSSARGRLLPLNKLRNASIIVNAPVDWVNLGGGDELGRGRPRKSFS